MKDAQPRTIRLSEYQPPAYRTQAVDLHFDIRDGSTLVTSRLEVVREGDGALRLDGVDLELVSLAVDGAPLSSNAYEVDDESLTLFDVGASATIEIVTRIEPEKNTALEGLYKSSRMYCTQCEAEGFRKITYYQDRPDVLARFTTTVEADAEQYPTLLANGNRIAEQEKDGRKSVTWEDPFPKPCYLFALVAGDLAMIEDHFTTMSGRTVTLQIFSEPHNIGQCDYAMDALKRAMRWDEEVFGREYDLDIFMVVAVEDFNMGAMENKGLNIFNTSCVLASADTATDLAYQRVEAVVAHEYFHNWSGNRVTCRDWFQLSLKEGFTVFRDAEFSSDMNARTVKRIEDARFLRSVQFAEDGGPLAHPVRPESYIEISNFYTVTIYEKGAEVVRMLHTLLGSEKFRAGSDLYFDRHDGQAATTDDFVAAMQEQTDLDLTQFQRWYQQAGTPVVSVESTFADGTLRLELTQSCPATPGQSEKQPFHIPFLIGLLDADGRSVQLEPGQVSGSVRAELRGESILVHLTDAACTLEIDGLDAPPSLSTLREFSAPVRVQRTLPSRDLAFLAANDVDGFARWDALQTLLVDEVRRLGTASEVSPTLIETFRKLLADAAGASATPDRFLYATMLAVPDEAYLFEAITPVDVDAICSAREKLKRGLANALREEWLALYEQYNSNDTYEPSPEQMAKRALSLSALSFSALAAEDEQLTPLLVRHYESADNLTDRRAAFGELVSHPGAERAAVERVAAEFYERFKHEALVVDAWISAQAQSPLCDVQRMRELEAHPAFDAGNPNKIRALYGAFSMRNPQRFHDGDGSGYNFMADVIIDLDSRNPQMASRMCTELTRFRRYDPARQRLMRAALEKIAAKETLSKDVYEVVAKSLDDGN